MLSSLTFGVSGKVGQRRCHGKDPDQLAHGRCLGAVGPTSTVRETVVPSPRVQKTMLSVYVPSPARADLVENGTKPRESACHFIIVPCVLTFLHAIDYVCLDASSTQPHHSARLPQTLSDRGDSLLDLEVCPGFKKMSSLQV